MRSGSYIMPGLQETGQPGYCVARPVVVTFKEVPRMEQALMTAGGLAIAALVILKTIRG